LSESCDRPPVDRRLAAATGVSVSEPRVAQSVISSFASALSGLAKTIAVETADANLADSPTVTSPHGVTRVGVLLGTAAYMAPEQIKGKAADKRADIWAFGCVLWTPDGRRLIFTSQRAGALNLYWQAADGTRIIFNELTPTMRRDVMMLTLEGSRRVQPRIQTPFDERNGTLSRDGRWLAYESDSSGKFEIYVRPFPAVGDGQWQTSSTGGTQPFWAKSDRELFYLAADGGWMTVRVESRGGTWSAGTPTKIFEGRYTTTGTNPGRMYDLSSDGHRFLLVKPAGSDSTADAPPSIVIVQNWFEEKRLVPTR
jgi:serine/threonine protein kinase